jgi:hypothetical protein
MCVCYRRGLLRAALVFLIVLFTTSVSAHEGPPFPIVQDKPVGPAVISIWTDPDVGKASFFVLVNAPAGGVIPSDLRVRLGVQPKSGRLAEVNYEMQREDLRGQVQYKAMAYLDQQELWRIRVTVASAGGGGEVISEVEATPPGYGRWDLLIYLLPFVAVGLLWMRAVLKRRRG